MKRVIVGLLLGAFCCALLATPSAPWGRDPRLPSITVYEDKDKSRSTGDEAGWTDPHQAPCRCINGHFIIMRWFRDTDVIRYLGITAIMHSVTEVFTTPNPGTYETDNQHSSE